MLPAVKEAELPSEGTGGRSRSDRDRMVSIFVKGVQHAVTPFLLPAAQGTELRAAQQWSAAKLVRIKSKCSHKCWLQGLVRVTSPNSSIDKWCR